MKEKKIAQSRLHEQDEAGQTTIPEGVCEHIHAPDFIKIVPDYSYIQINERNKLT